ARIIGQQSLLHLQRIWTMRIDQVRFPVRNSGANGEIVQKIRPIPNWNSGVTQIYNLGDVVESSVQIEHRNLVATFDQAGDEGLQIGFDPADNRPIRSSEKNSHRSPAGQNVSTAPKLL